MNPACVQYRSEQFHRPTNHRHATKQNVKPHFRQAPHSSYHDKGLRTVLQSRRPKVNRLQKTFGKEHLTKNCEIKERQENPYCINCETYGHTACYTKCPKPKKGTPLENRNKKAFTSNNVVEGISFANMVSGKTKNNDAQPTTTNRTNSGQSHPITPPTDEINSSDFQDLIALFKIVSNIFKQYPKLKQIIPELKKTKDFQKQACMLLEAIWD
ncbi:uncharacterized protein TNCV_1377631 [Trichonephila clavipes]|nr:uncharacterized protein TNCV_1377631 [Trichonephila clavipes]